MARLSPQHSSRGRHGVRVIEPFVKSGETAGTAALSTLFGSSNPAPAKAAPKAPSTNSLASPDSGQETHDVTPVELGEYGKLGEMPPDGKPQPTEGEQASETSATETPAPKWLEVPVTDDKGRRKVRVDLNNTEQLTKTVAMAHGFRKMQAERDQLKEQLKTASPRLTELETNWQALEKTYQEGGIEGLVDLLQGKKGAFGEWKRAEFQKDQRYANASESEKKQIQLEAELAQLKRESVTREKNATEQAKKAVAEREEGQLRSLEAQMIPHFNKNRFAGTLGDEGKEARLDKAIWQDVIDTLVAMPDDAEITPAIMQREFRNSYLAFKGTIGKQASAQTKQVLDKRKQVAQTAVAAAATSRTTGSGTIHDSMVANIKKGGQSGLLNGLMDVLRSR